MNFEEVSRWIRGKFINYYTKQYEIYLRKLWGKDKSKKKTMATISKFIC